MCESEQLLQVIRSTVTISTRRQDPHVHAQGLGKQWSSDPSPYSHKAVLEAARIAALAASAASAAVADMRKMLQGQAHALHLAAMAASDVTTTMERTPQAITDSVAHIRATKGRNLPVGDIPTLLDAEAAAMAGAITVGNERVRLDAETSAAAALAAELNVDQHSDSSDGLSVGQSGSEGDSELSSSEDDFLAPGEGDQDATPMLSAEKSPPPTVMSARTRSHTNLGRTDPVRVLNMPPKSDESSGNDDDGGDASSEDVTDPESDPLAVLALQQLTLLLQDEDGGGTDPRHGGHFSTHECYVILDATEGDQLWKCYFHGAESTWRYSSHSVIRGFRGPGAFTRASTLFNTAQAAMPARSRLSFDGQHDFNGEEDWERHLEDAPISDLDMTITPSDCEV